MITIATLQTAEASHFRYGTISWVPTENNGEVEFRMKIVFRNFGSFSVGDVVTGAIGYLYFGDGSYVNITPTVTNVNLAENYFEGEFVVRKTYTGTGPYIASWSSCCRIYGIANASSSSWRLQTTVQPFSGNSSPVSNQFPIVSVGQGTASTFFVNAADNDGDNLRFRIATPSESLVFSAVPNLTMNPNTGQMTWNNSSLTIGSLWAVQVIVEDLDVNGNVKTQTPVDFMLKVLAVQSDPPSCEISPAGPITAALESNVTFDATATAGNPALSVTLAGIGLPSGSSMTPTLPATGIGSVSSQFNWVPSASQTGSFVLNYSATDQYGQQAQCGININVISNQPPVADAGPDQTIECPACDVVLDGSGSEDPDGDSLTYSWSGPFGTVTGVNPTVDLSLGVHTITLTVDDGNGGSDTNDVVITIEDTTPPELTTQSEPFILWPPNHKYHTFNIVNFIESVSDACDDNVGISGVVITRVSSDEPEEQAGSDNGKGRKGGGGDGNTADDIVIATDGLSVDLRAERLGGGNGRVYTIYVGIVDASGNSTESSFQVHVPNSVNSTAIDDGMLNGYEVIGLTPVASSSSPSAMVTSNDSDGSNGSTNAYNKTNSSVNEQSKVLAIELPETFVMHQNYPNPFNPSTVIRYQVPSNVHVNIQVYDLAGRLITTLVDGNKSLGNYEVTFNADNMNSGIYFYRITAGNFVEIKKMTLIK